MNQDYATQWLKLAGKCFAWIVGISFVGGALLGIAMGIGTHDNSFFLMPLLTVFYACVYSMIPVALFASFIVALRAGVWEKTVIWKTVETQ